MKLYSTAFALVALIVMSALAVLATGPGPGQIDGTRPVDSAKDSSASAIAWVRFDKGLALAESENKPLLVDITASWCGWCKKMEKETFMDTSVINLVNSTYVPVKLWGDSEEMLDIKGYKISQKDFVASAFGISGYPTFVFLCPDSRGIAKIPGYRKTEDFKKILTAVQGFDCDSAKAADSTEEQSGQ